MLSAKVTQSTWSSFSVDDIQDINGEREQHFTGTCNKLSNFKVLENTLESFRSFILTVFCKKTLLSQKSLGEKKKWWTCSFYFYDCYICLVQSPLTEEKHLKSNNNEHNYALLSLNFLAKIIAVCISCEFCNSP